MPFDPDKYLAEKQAATAQPSANSDAAFNPDSYLASKGVNNLPNQGNIQNGASTADLLAQQASDTYQKYAPVAGQGAALGYGKQLNAGIQAAAGAVDQAVNGANNFGDQSSPDAGLFQRTVDAISNVGENYKTAKAGVASKIAAVRASDPIKSALLEIGSSIPASYVLGAALKGLGMANGIAQAGTLGSLYTYGSSDKQGVDALKDAAKGGAIAAGTAGALTLAGKGLSALKNADYGKYLEAEYGDYSKPVQNVQEMTASGSASDPYALDYKTKFGEPFRLGQQMGKSMLDPNVQSQVTQELNNQPQVAQQIIDQTKSNLGTMRDAVKQQVASVENDANPLFKKIYDFIDGISVGKNDADRLAARADLRSAVESLEDGMGSGQDPVTNKLSKTTLGDLIDTQSSFGRQVFEDKVFNRDSVVNGAAKKVWGMLADHVSNVDETAGSGGQVSAINKVFKAMYGMEDNMINGTTIKSLTDPQAVGADNRYSEFVKPFQELPANLRQTLAPEMHDYLANQFPKTFAKAKIMLLATERGAQSALSNKNFWSLAGLRNLKSALSAGTQNRLGALTSSTPDLSIPQGALNGVNSGLESIAPSIGALSTDNSQPQPPPALNYIR